MKSSRAQLAVAVTEVGDDPERPAARVLDGRYALLDRLGRGAAGTTYRARRLSDGAIVAIKELLVRDIEDLGAIDRFKREASTLESLDHPAIPGYHDDLVVEDGRDTGFYLVFDYVEGETLADHGQRRDEDDVLGLLDELLAVLVYLHGLNPPIIHRDIKPSNVIIRPDGRAALVDFGSVRDAVEAGGHGTTVSGTYGYMPPEQLAGQAGPESDLYALGALAVTLLSGRDPRDLLDENNRLQWEQAVKVTPGTRALLRRLLEPSRAQRLKSALKAKAVLQAVRAGEVPAELTQAAGATGLAATPPPVPRPLPSRFGLRAAPASYTWQTAGLATAGGLGMVGLGGAALGGLLGIATLVSFGLGAAAVGAILGIGLFARGWWTRRRARKIYEYGATTVGRVTSVTKYSAWLFGLRGTRPIVIRYRYDVGGTTHVGKATRWVGEDPIRAGDEITVLYNEKSRGDSLIYPLGGERSR